MAAKLNVDISKIHISKLSNSKETDGERRRLAEAAQGFRFEFSLSGPDATEKLEQFKIGDGQLSSMAVAITSPLEFR
jgi:hypothetical protein